MDQPQSEPSVEDHNLKPGVVAHTFKPLTLEAEATRSLEFKTSLVYKGRVQATQSPTNRGKGIDSHRELAGV